MSGSPGRHDSARSRDKLHSWIFKIAANVARTARSNRRHTHETFGGEVFDDARTVGTGGGEITPFEAIQQVDADERLAKALAELAPERALLLHTLSGMKYREVAEALGCPIGKLTTRIHVARERLAKLLERS